VEGIFLKQTKDYLPSLEISLFCDQVVLILKSGIPLHDGMEALYHNYQNTKYAVRFQMLADGIENNQTFYDSLVSLDIFPPYMVNMVRIGERTGKLEAVMQSLADYYRKEDTLRKNGEKCSDVSDASGGMMAVVITVLLWKVLPIFNEIYKNLGTELYTSSESLMRIGNIIGKVIIALIGLLILLILISAVFLESKKRERYLDFLGNIFGPIRRLREKIAAERFASSVSMMIASGFHIEEAIELAPSIISNPQFLKNWIYSVNCLHKIFHSRMPLSAHRFLNHCIAK
jgi:type IV pilus assembly protein PilC